MRLYIFMDFDHIAFERADLSNDTEWFEKNYLKYKEEMLEHYHSTCFLWKNFSNWYRTNILNRAYIRHMLISKSNYTHFLYDINEDGYLIRKRLNQQNESHNTTDDSDTS